MRNNMANITYLNFIMAMTDEEKNRSKYKKREQTNEYDQNQV